MTADFILFCIVGIFIGEMCITKILSYLNAKNFSETLPSEAKYIYDEEKYAKSQRYEKTKYTFGSLSSFLSFIVILVLLLFGVFGWLDIFLRQYIDSLFFLSLAYFGVLTVGNTLLQLPFSYYATFVIEGSFGFNKMTKKIFFIDAIKSFILTLVLGGGILSIFIGLYLWLGEMFWLSAWICMTLFSLCMMMFYSSLIVPIFNKQTPLPKGELRDKIEEFTKKALFPCTEIFVIDGSTRSAKANAYFSGFGPKKRIVLYDTLIQDMTSEEIVAVLAHEIGHFKKRHTLQMFIFSTLQTGAMLYIFSLALSVPEISLALGAQEQSFHVGLIAFGFLFTPLSFIFGLFSSILSRKNEYEADAFAKSYGLAGKLESALIKLTRKNLSNLSPHPAYEFFYYSHPSVLKRLKALQS